ncbi:MAG TPA: hypothetical protein VMA09_03655 [Candidatus Binataceae bacterium]|nr:hypothetical protein [Candidatus Binataceae bacterium]
MSTLRFGALLIALVACALCGSVVTAAPAFADAMPIFNADFSKGSGGQVQGWYAAAMHHKEADFGWSRTAGGYQVSIVSHVLNYATWRQAMMLGPGWYRVSAFARVDDAIPPGAGATLAVQTFRGARLVSNEIHGTSAWTPLVLYLKVERWGQITQILLQAGEEHTQGSGSAYFRDLRVESIAAPSADASNVYDLSTIAMAHVSPLNAIDYQRPLGILCGLFLLGAFAVCLAIIWRSALAHPTPAMIAGIVVLLAITVIEFVGLFHFEGYFWDALAKTNRSILAAALGPRRIYDQGLPVDSYPPGSLYLLWLSGWLGQVIEPGYNAFRVLVETPPLIASLVTGLTLLFAYAGRGRGWRGFVAMLLFAANPTLIFDTVVWGQSDAVVALAMLVAAFLILRGQYRLGWIAAGIALLTKPQAVAMIPPLGLWTLINTGLTETAICAALSVGAFIIGVLPYDAGHSIHRMIEVYQSLGGRFTDASVGAFNLHAMLGGLETPDSTRVGFVSYYALGISMLLGAFAVVLFLVWRARNATAVMLATFIAMFALYTLAPRMHERYVYYPLVFLVPLAFESRFLAASFAILTATSFYNLYFMKWLADTSTFFSDHAAWPIVTASAINVLLLAAIMAYALFRLPLRNGLNSSS